MGLVRFLAAVAVSIALSSGTAAAQVPPDRVVQNWYRLILELVRHTPTYSPPVASRAFAYAGVTAFEAVATGAPQMRSLAGQLNGLAAVPQRDEGAAYDEAVVLQEALARAAQGLFSNTGPTGQRAMAAMAAKLSAQTAAGLPADVVARSTAHGQAVAAHVLAWAATDGGAVIENMGFPPAYELATAEGKWVPTSKIAQQHKPLLPGWGGNRTFAMPAGAACDLPPPPAYSTDPASEFYRQAREVYDTVRDLTPEQRAIARFWSDDPMLSPTPPGHWISIAMQVLDDRQAGLTERVDVLARLGVTLADAFVACWHTKFRYDLLRPVTYIRAQIDPAWETVLITPPFPEYPSGHSTQSAAAATVLGALFGEPFAFTDATHTDDGLPPRSFGGFWAAAEEAGLSRLYGGIHFRAAIERGLEQGRCVGAYATALQTRTAP